MAAKTPSRAKSAAPAKPSRARPARPTSTPAPKKAAPAKKAPPAKANDNVRHVVPDKGAGDWNVKQPKAAAPTAKEPTQKKAEIAAKKQVKAAGGGQVVIHNRKGKIRDADTVKPGNESKRKDTKH